MPRRIRIETVIHEKRSVNIDSMIGSTSDSSWPELYELNKNGAINRPALLIDSMTKRDTDADFVAQYKPIYKGMYRRSKRRYSQQCYIAREQQLRAQGMSKRAAREQANKERNEYLANQRQTAIDKGPLIIKKERSENNYIIASKQVMYDNDGNIIHEHIEYLQDYTYRKVRTRSGNYTSKRMSLGHTAVNLDSKCMTTDATGRITNTYNNKGTPDYVYEPTYRHVMGMDNDTGRYLVGDACILRIGESQRDNGRHYNASALQIVLQDWSLRDLRDYHLSC